MRLSSLVILLGVLFAVSPEAAGAGDRHTDRAVRVPENAVLAFAVIGDGEPKPDAEFPGISAAVESINAMRAQHDLSFVAGIGDIPHKATIVQYEASVGVLENLQLPFYPIMGNEEYNGTEQRYLEYANRWNQGRVEIDALKYTVDTEHLALIFATAEIDGRDFHDSEVQWIEDELDSIGKKPAMLFIHGAPQAVFPEGGDKGVRNPAFLRLMEKNNLIATFSGDLHMDLNRVQGAREKYGVHHVHVPALERTKLPDKAQHIPYFRIVSVLEQGDVVISTVNAVTGEIEPSFEYRFSLDRPER